MWVSHKIQTTVRVTCLFLRAGSVFDGGGGEKGEAKEREAGNEILPLHHFLVEQGREAEGGPLLGSWKGDGGAAMNGRGVPLPKSKKSLGRLVLWWWWGGGSLFSHRAIFAGQI